MVAYAHRVLFEQTRQRDHLQEALRFSDAALACADKAGGRAARTGQDPDSVPDRLLRQGAGFGLYEDAVEGGYRFISSPRTASGCGRRMS